MTIEDPSQQEGLTQGLGSRRKSRGLGGQVADIGRGAVAGIEDFGRDLLGLVDTVTPGLDLGLPKGRLIDDAETTAGKLVQGISNFMAGFVPALGLIGKFGKLGRVANLTTAAEKAARTAGKIKTATAISLGRGAAAGALADFTGFDGNEERLSNLIEEFPQLSNFVTEFLAAKEDDPELIGRGKQVLEGLGAGFLIDGLVMGLRGLKGQRAKRAKLDATPLDAAQGVDEAIPAKEAAEVSAKARRVKRGEEPGLMPDGSPETKSKRTVSMADGKERILKLGEKRRASRKAADAPGSPVKGSTPAKDREVLKGLSRTEAGRKRVLKERMNLTDEELARGLTAFEQRREGGRLLAITDENGVTQIDPFVNPRTLTAEQRSVLGLGFRDANLSRVIAEEDVGFLVRTYESIFGPLPAGVEAKMPVSDEDVMRVSVEDLADRIRAAEPGQVMPSLIEGVENRSTMLNQALRESLGDRHMMVTHAGEWLDTIRQGVDTDEGLAKVMQMGADHVLLAKFLREEAGGAGRFLRSFGLQSRNLKDVEVVMEALGKQGSPEQARRVAEIIQRGLEGGGVEGAAHAVKMMEMTTTQRSWAILNEFYINSILSGAKTFATNLLSPGLLSIHLPIENLVGGAITQQPGVMRNAIRQLDGLRYGFQDSMRMAKRSFAMGDNILDPKRTVRDDPFARGKLGALTPETLGLDPDSASGAALSWFGTVVRMPTRLLMASDEFVKQMNYRTVARSRFIEEGMENGLSGPLLARHVTERMEKVTIEGQAFSLDALRAQGEKLAKDQGITDRIAKEAFVVRHLEANFDPKLSRVAEEGVERANTAALTTDLPEGSLSRGMQNLTSQHPYLRLVAPFIRTPVNIVKAAAARAPNPWGITEATLAMRHPKGAPALERLRTSFAKEVYSGDPDRVAAAVGKQAFGLAGVTFFAGIAAQGLITGRGPSDKEQRDVLTAAGWQPYSVRVGDSWVSYLRLDPFATFIGTVADVYDYARLAPADEQESIGTLTMAMTTALANNFTNKTYLQGISDVVDAMSEPDRKLAGVLERYAGTVIPNTLAQAVEVGGDETMRDIHGLSERLRSRVPGMSDTVPVMRNMFGEPMSRPRGFALGLENLPGPVGDILSMISPITYRDVSDETVEAELIVLQHGFGPPSPTRFGVDLLGIVSSNGQSAYDRWLQLHGEVRVGGRSMRDEMRRLIASPAYQSLSPVSTSTATSPRVAAINNVLGEYRDEAWQQMLSEFPQLGRDLSQAGRTRRTFLAQSKARRFSLGGVVPTIGNIGG